MGPRRSGGRPGTCPAQVRRSNASNRSSTSLPRPRWSARRPAHQRITLSSRSCPWSIDVERRALRVAPEDHRGQGDAQSATARRPAARRAYDSRRPHIAARDLRVRQKRAQNALPVPGRPSEKSSKYGVALRPSVVAGAARTKSTKHTTKSEAVLE